MVQRIQKRIGHESHQPSQANSVYEKHIGWNGFGTIAIAGRVTGMEYLWELSIFSYRHVCFF